MSTEKEKKASSQHSNDDGEMKKYAVACTCPHDIPPKKEGLVKIADGSYICPECGRRHETKA